MKKVLGVIGGMGPEATAYFYEEVIAHTKAERDQDHIDMVILSHASMPDRTAAILSGDDRGIMQSMERSVRMLENCGVQNIAIPCNTSHYFYDRIQGLTQIPVINMPGESVSYICRLYPQAVRVGIMATDGTLRTGIYANVLQEAGLVPVVPGVQAQKAVMSLIYDDIKTGRDGDPAKFEQAYRDLTEQGADLVILACTEISVYKKKHTIPANCLDAMDVLVRESVIRSGAEYV